MSKIDEELFSEILYNTGVLLPISTTSKGSRVEAMCRTKTGMDKDWPPLAERILNACDSLGLDSHVCRRYVTKGGSLVYGIHVEVGSTNAKALRASLGNLEEAIGAAATEKARPATQTTPAVPVMSYKEYKKETKATPRAPMPGELKDIKIPDGFQYQSKRVASGQSANGTLLTIDEIPLPNIHHEMNIPNAKGRGAKFTG